MWSKNEHNLFDFENSQYVKKSIEVDFSSKIIFIEQELLAIQKEQAFKTAF